jgi:YcxB-like protein
MTDLRSLEVIIQLEQNDISRANIDIALGRFTPYRWLTFGVSSATLSAMFSYLIFSHYNDFADPSSAVLFGVLFGLLIVPALLIAMIHVTSGNTAKSLLRNAPALKGPTRWIFSDNGIETYGPTAQAEMKWKAFTRVRETKRQFLLYPQDNIAYVIPKHCFQTEIEIGRLREMIRRCVPTPSLQSSHD